MARLFDDAQEEYLEIDQAVLSGAPLVMACKFKADTLGIHQALMNLSDKDVSGAQAQSIRLIIRDSNVLTAQVQNGSTYPYAQSSITVSVDTWHHACGLFVSAADRRILLEGGNKGTDTTDCTPVNLDRTNIGVIGDATRLFYLSGMIAEVAVWDLSAYPGATPSDKADYFEANISPDLAAGHPPSDYPLGLIAYWPLIDDDLDYADDFDMTPFNTPSWATHPPMIITAFPETLELALTQHAPTITLGATVTPSALELALALQTPTMHSSYTALPSTFELALTQHAPGLAFDYTITPDALALALTQHAPSLAFDYTIFPSTLELALTLHAPTVIIPADVTILPGTLQLVASLLTPEIVTRFATIPSFMLKDLIDPYSGGAWLWLIEISVPGYDTVRKARNTEDIEYNGANFPKGNFDVGRQSLSGDGSIPRIVLRVAQDPDHVLEDIVNATKGGADGTVKLIRTCEKFLDTPVEALEAEYDILIAGSDVEWMTFSIGIPNLLTQRIPLWLYSSKVCPLATPSLFKGPRCRYVGGDTVCTGLLEDCYAKGNAVHWGAEIGLDPNAVRI